MTHVLQGGFGYIMPTSDSPTSPVYVHKTVDSSVLITDGPNDLTGVAFYIDMVSGWGTTPPVAGLYNFYVEWSPVEPITSFYKAGDTSGTPTATTFPPSIEPFAIVRDNSGTDFGMDFFYARTDSSIVYDSGAHSVTHTGSSQTIIGADLGGLSNFRSDLTGSGAALKFGIDATGPTDSYWRLYAMGLRYPIITTGTPLRQFPRNDGLRSTRRQGAPGPTSRQGSIRRGPAGNYT